MFSLNRLGGVLPGVVLAVTLSACGAAVVSPEAGAPVSPSPEAPVGTGEFVPDAEWFAGLDEARNGLAEYVDWWGLQDCSYQKVVDGDFNCTIHLAGIQEQVVAVDSFLTDVVDIAPGSEQLVADLAVAAGESAQAAKVAKDFSDSGCDFSPGESCASGADELVSLGGILSESLAAWEAPVVD